MERTRARTGHIDRPGRGYGAINATAALETRIRGPASVTPEFVTHVSQEDPPVHTGQVLLLIGLSGSARLLQLLDSPT